jgi:predicted RNA-binding protein Jag
LTIKSVLLIISIFIDVQMSPTIQNQINSLLSLTLGKVAVIISLNFEKEGSETRVSIQTNNNIAFLENKNEVLEAIQHFVRKVIHLKNPDDKTHFVLDIGHFNKNREYILSVKVPELAQDIVLIAGRTVIIVGLNSFERLFVHNILSDVNGIVTSSVGIDNNRKLLLMPTCEFGAASIDDSFVFNIETIKNDPNIDMYKQTTRLAKLYDTQENNINID